MSNKTGVSLGEVHSSIDTTIKKGYWRRLLAFLGPAYLVSVGYMDPGNWATDIAGGSQFGYTLIWVLMMSNIMAILLQSLSARLGIVRGLDLAQASKEYYPPFINIILYGLAETAIVACDLAEVLGMAIGLNLLFGLPLIYGVLITFLDTFILMFLINRGMRVMEAFILALILIIGVAFLVEMIYAQPIAGELIKGFIPILPNDAALYIAIGIIGATVMPHNLYLHSSLVQTRKFNSDKASIKQAIRFNIIDSIVALNLAFFVNAAILILAASAFYKNGHFDVTEIEQAYKFLAPILGSHLAPILFAVALIAAGQSSTITGTLAGQIVMEGHINLRIRPWLRRIITRSLAIIPAVLVIVLMGESYTGKLLVFSQVVLSLQLGFAVVPLIHFVSSKEKMGTFAIRRYVVIVSWLIALIILSLNIKLVFDEIHGWLLTSSIPLLIWLTVVPIVSFFGLVMLFITFGPLFVKRRQKMALIPHEVIPLKLELKPEFKRIALALDFTHSDADVINYAISTGRDEAEYLLMHVVESAGTFVFGSDIQDLETQQDTIHLEGYAEELKAQGYRVETLVGFGSPKHEIPRLVSEFNADLLVMGAHGHSQIKKIIFGQTVNFVRRKLRIPVLVVRHGSIKK
ncbi:MAG TPA: Nramp family divalent metal transporter [Williamwhitmania sp.]|nr:Nramp family divalent metal transporter [Williamwhitmania sp.]